VSESQDDQTVCPNCKIITPNQPHIRQGSQFIPELGKTIGILSIGFRCKTCGHIWGHEGLDVPPLSDWKLLFIHQAEEWEAAMEVAVQAHDLVLGAMAGERAMFWRNYVKKGNYDADALDAEFVARFGDGHEIMRKVEEAKRKVGQ
jgi:hypothetical protein